MESGIRRLMSRFLHLIPELITKFPFPRFPLLPMVSLVPGIQFHKNIILFNNQNCFSKILSLISKRMRIFIRLQLEHALIIYFTCIFIHNIQKKGKYLYAHYYCIHNSATFGSRSAHIYNSKRAIIVGHCAARVSNLFYWK